MPDPEKQDEKPAADDAPTEDADAAADGGEAEGDGDGKKEKEASPEQPTALPAVAHCFAMGWQMAELYRRPAHSVPPSDDPPPAGGLPGLSGLRAGARAEIAVLEVEATLRSLKEQLEAVAVDPPSTAGVREAMKGSGSNDPIRNEVYELHIALLGRLTAVDFRLGKAYGLGRALAETCVVADLAELRLKLGEHRIAQISEWLADLATVLPDHAGRATQISLERWGAWAARQDDESWAGGGEKARRALTRQAQLWRTLLSGEKDGVDMLDIEDYTEAADRLIEEGKVVVKSLLRRYDRYLGPLAAVVFVLVLIAIFNESASSAVVAIAAAAGALGVSWKGIGTLLADLGEKLRKPLWGAELDRAIAEAITLVPDAEVAASEPVAAHPIGPALAPPPAAVAAPEA